MAESNIGRPGIRLRFRLPKKAQSPEASVPVLASYHPVTRSRAKRIFAFVGLMLFCFIYGFYFSILVPNVLAFLVSPLIFLLFLVIWALPDSNWAPTRALEWLLYGTLIALIGWPDYLAIALPGLPWITLTRLTSFPLLLVLLVCISMSADFRSTLARSLRAVNAIPILLIIFVIIQLYSIALSQDISGSIQKFIVAQTTWTSVFFASAYVFLHPGRVKRWAIMLWILAAYVSVIALWEYHVGHLPWSGHIPVFLKVNDESVERILAGSMRAGTTRYRAQATFGTPLGLAEYIALVLPFVLHFATKRYPLNIRWAAMCSIPLLVYADYLTDAKLGTIGCLLGILLYIFAAAFQNWRRHKHSLVAGAILFAYPAGLAAVVAALLFVQRIRVMVLGGSSHDASTDARIAQYTVGLQKFLEWPFGYGIGQGAPTLGFGAQLSGMITIDTYYLSIILEYGVAGFIVYFGMFAIAIYEGVRRSLRAPSNDEDGTFLLPITISLITFIMIKSVFSQQDNHPVVFMVLGALVAIVASSRKGFDARPAKTIKLALRKPAN